MDDITASIIVACQTSGAQASINKLGFSFSMLAKKAFDFGAESLAEFKKTQDAAWKFGKVFENSMGSANKMAEKFREEYNLSEQTALTMLGEAGNAVSTMGFDDKDALEISETIAKWGIDLASYTSYAGGAKGATEAIIASLYGENERLKSLGILLREDSDEYRNMVTEIMATKRVSEQQAKVLAKLAMIEKQGAKAKGDYIAEGENFTQTINISKEAVTQFKTNVGKFIYTVFDANNVMGAFGEEIIAINNWWKKEGQATMFAVRELFIDIFSFIELVGDTLKPLWAIFITGIQNIVTIGQWFYENWSKIWDNSGDIVLAVFKDLWEYIKWFWGPNGMILGFFDTVGKSIAKAIKAGFTGGDIIEAFAGEWQKYMDNNVVGGFAKQGRNMEQALARAGVSKMPKLKSVEFTVFDDYNKTLDKNARKHKNNLKRYEASLLAAQDRNANKNIADFTVDKKAMYSAFGQVLKEFNQFRNTSQQSIMSGSVEAMRLRSRRFVNSGGVDYAQMTAEYNKTQVKTLGDMLHEITSITSKMTNISTTGVPIKGLSVRTH